MIITDDIHIIYPLVPRTIRNQQRGKGKDKEGGFSVWLWFMVYGGWWLVVGCCVGWLRWLWLRITDPSVE